MLKKDNGRFRKDKNGLPLSEAPIYGRNLTGNPFSMIAAQIPRGSNDPNSVRDGNAANYHYTHYLIIVVFRKKTFSN